MRKIILSINITKDDFIAGLDGGLDWHFPYWNPEMSDALGRLLNNCDTILLGRNTYNAFAEYWTANRNNISVAGEDIALADMMNRYSKIVVSSSLRRLQWANSLPIRGDILSEVIKLKEKQGKDIIVLGSCRLVSYLILHDLIDEYCLWVHPICIRRGMPLPELTTYLLRTKSVRSEIFNCGVIKVTYDKQSGKEANGFVSGTELVKLWKES